MFGWLDMVRARPGMYVGDSARPLRELETLVYGYYAALLVHGTIEPVPQMDGHFGCWLREQTGWSTSCGWADAIERHAGRRPALDVFFALVDRYRRLTPTVLAEARLGPRKAPTGKRVVMGLAGRMKRPSRVQIVRYAPSRLHFLRFFYGRRAENRSALLTDQGSQQTSLAFAKRWAARELGTTASDWR